MKCPEKKESGQADGQLPRVETPSWSGECSALFGYKTNCTNYNRSHFRSAFRRVECCAQRSNTKLIKKMADLSARDIERAKFAFSIYDFEGNETMDGYYIGDLLRALNLNPTLAVIEKVGGAKRRNEKKVKLDEFLPIFSQVKKDKDAGSYEDFLEVLKLYDKSENGTMLYAELEHILMSLGERLEKEQVDLILKETCDEEDEDGFIPYEPFLKRLLAFKV